MPIGIVNSFLASTLTYTSRSYALSNLVSLYSPTSGVCDASPFTYDAVTQSTTTFIFFEGTARTIPITPLSVTYSCGTYATTIKYSATRSNYSALPAWLSISASTGTLSVTSGGVAGTYNITVIGRTSNQ